MKAVTHLEKVIAGETSAVTHLEKVIAQETAAVTYTEKVIAGTAPPVTHLQKVIAGEARPVTHLEYVWAGGSPPSVQEYTGAVPVTFIADGTPLLDYLISGNTVQSGTPTPDNPIMPEGTGEKTGNLFDMSTVENGKGIAINGSIVDYEKRCSTVTPIDVSTYSNVTLAFTATLSSTRVIYALFNDSALVTRQSTVKSGTTIDVSGGNKLYICFYDATELVQKSDLSNVMLNTGSTALPYEPYGYKIPISSANTTTTVYLGKAQTTRKIKKLVLTGEETIPNNDGASYNSETSTDRFVRDIPFSVGDNGTSEIILCTHLGFQAQSWAARTKTGCCIYCSGNTMQLHLRFDNTTLGITQSDTNEQRTEKLKAYLAAQYAAGTPVTVWYVLTNEETAVVNEPLMRIGDYADTLSMEQAGVSIPTANGSTTLDVETTVKPSEVYIKYRGEAVATLSMLSAEVSSPEATEEVNPEETEEEENGSEDVSLQYKPEAIE